jgi:hypothetical protein
MVLTVFRMESIVTTSIILVPMFTLIVGVK